MKSSESCGVDEDDGSSRIHEASDDVVSDRVEIGRDSNRSVVYQHVNQRHVVPALLDYWNVFELGRSEFGVVDETEIQNTSVFLGEAHAEEIGDIVLDADVFVDGSRASGVASVERISQAENAEEWSAGVVIGGEIGLIGDQAKRSSSAQVANADFLADVIAVKATGTSAVSDREAAVLLHAERSSEHTSKARRSFRNASSALHGIASHIDISRAGGRVVERSSAASIAERRWNGGITTSSIDQHR